MDKLLTIRDLTKSFEQRGTVLDNLCLEVEEGDLIAIMGPSGSGKTTLLNIVGMLDRPDSGEILYRGNRTEEFTEADSAGFRNRNIGFVFQEHLLLPHLTIHENILMPLLPSKLKPDELSSRESYIRSLMERTSILSMASKYPHQVSGGEAQRAALVRALVNKPAVVLADEPTGALDSGNAGLLGDLLIEMNRTLGTTIILATHSLSLAAKMSRQLELTEGKLLTRN